MNRPDPMLTQTAVAGAALVALGFVAFGSSVGFGAIAGASLAVANVLAFQWVVSRLFASSRAGMLLPLKLLGVMTAVFVLQRVVGFDPVGLALGYGALVVGLLTASARPHRQAAPVLRSTEI